MPEESTELKISVPVYNATDVILPPSAAKDAVITGSNNLPYSPISATVLIPNAIKALDGDKSIVATLTVPASSIALPVCPPCPFNSETRAMTVKIQKQVVDALLILG